MTDESNFRVRLEEGKNKKKIVIVLTIYAGQKTRNQNMCFLQILEGFLQINSPRASAAWQQSVQFSLNLMFIMP
jgi:hypothetical protein